MQSPVMPFTEWLDKLLSDAVMVKKFKEVNMLGVEILCVLYESGVFPSVEGIIEAGSNEWAA